MLLFVLGKAPWNFFANCCVTSKSSFFHHGNINSFDPCACIRFVVRVRSVICYLFVRLFNRFVRTLVPSVVHSLVLLFCQFSVDRMSTLHLFAIRTCVCSLVCHCMAFFCSFLRQYKTVPFLYKRPLKKLPKESGRVLCLPPFPSARKILICILFMRSFVRLQGTKKFNFPACPSGKL